MKDRQQESILMTPSEAFNIFYFACNVHASCISPFIRKDFGAQHHRNYGLFTTILLLVVAGEDRSGLGTLYFFAWLAAVIFRRIETFMLMKKGTIIHSQYAGYPWLAMRFPFVRKESFAMGIIEPEMCLATGIALLPLSEPLGLLFMGGFISFLSRNGIERDVVKKRIQAMHDARIEQEYYSRLFRDPTEE